MGSTFQNNTNATINIINNHVQGMFNSDIPPGLKNDWKQPTIIENKTFDCESFNKSANTNKNCLKALIDNCEISLINQNDIINNRNCNNLLSYTKIFLNSWYTKTKNDYDRESTNWNSWDWHWDCEMWCSVVDCDKYWNNRLSGDKGKLYHNGPGDTDCTQYRGAGGADVGKACSWGFGAIIKRDLKNCNLMRNSDKWMKRIAQYQKVINEISCPTLSVIPAPPINCCNNVLNCEYAECINIVQICKQTISGETEISNATQCLTSSCPMNGQKCIKGTPGAPNFNWICQNNKWVRHNPQPQPQPQPTPPPPQPQPTPPPPTPPPPTSPPPPTPPSSDPTPPPPTPPPPTPPPPSSDPTPPSSEPTPPSSEPTPPSSDPTPPSSEPQPPSSEPQPTSPIQPRSTSPIQPQPRSTSPTIKNKSTVFSKSPKNIKQSSTQNYNLFIVISIIIMVILFMFYLFIK
jgi:hypothetical protein